MALTSRPPTQAPLYRYLWTLPTNTSFRFLLLATFVVGLTLNFCKTMPDEIFPALKARNEAAVSCLFPVTMSLVTIVLTVVKDPATLHSDSVSSKVRSLWDDAVRCATTVFSSTLGWQLGGLGLVLAMTGLLYWYKPAWTIWHRHLQPLTVASGLTSEDADALRAYLQGLRDEICGDNPAQHRLFPTFLWHPGDPWDPRDHDDDVHANAHIFGRWGHFYIVLNRKWVNQFLAGEDLPGLRAIVLHDLAHMQNADVHIWQATEALGMAALVVLAPLALGRLVLGPWNLALGVPVALTALVWVTQRSLLRVRELEADVRAAASPADREALLRVLEAAKSAPADSVPPPT